MFGFIERHEKYLEFLLFAPPCDEAKNSLLNIYLLYLYITLMLIITRNIFIMEEITFIIL